MLDRLQEYADVQLTSYLATLSKSLLALNNVRPSVPPVPPPLPFHTSSSPPPLRLPSSALSTLETPLTDFLAPSPRARAS